MQWWWWWWWGGGGGGGGGCHHYMELGIHVILLYVTENRNRGRFEISKVTA